MKQASRAPSRRAVLVGAGTGGALAAAASLLPAVRESASVAPAQPKAPENGGGYSPAEPPPPYYQTPRV